MNINTVQTKQNKTAFADASESVRSLARNTELRWKNEMVGNLTLSLYHLAALSHYITLSQSQIHIYVSVLCVCCVYAFNCCSL